jgi:hypothetical protein
MKLENQKKIRRFTIMIKYKLYDKSFDTYFSLIQFVFI